MLKENDQRGVNPSVYTTPATGFNTVTVDFLNDIDDDKTISAGNSILSMDSVGLIPMDGGSITGHPSTNKTLPRNFTSGTASLTLPNSIDKRRCSDGSLGTCATVSTGGGLHNEVHAYCMVVCCIWWLHDYSSFIVIHFFTIVIMQYYKSIIALYSIFIHHNMLLLEYY